MVYKATDWAAHDRAVAAYMKRHSPMEENKKPQFTFPPIEEKVIVNEDKTTDVEIKFVFPSALIGTVFKEEPVEAPQKKRVMVSLEGKVGSRVDSTKYTGNGHWQFPEDLAGPGYTGFIYVIIDHNTDKLYLGKKNFQTNQLVDGTTRRKKVDLNWRWYISSSKELSASVKNYGKEGFEFIAIEQYKTKGTLSYAETWSLMYVESPYRRDKWYNLMINKVTWVVKEPISQRHRDRLAQVMRVVGADKPMEA